MAAVICFARMMMDVYVLDDECSCVTFWMIILLNKGSIWMLRMMWTCRYGLHQGAMEQCDFYCVIVSSTVSRTDPRAVKLLSIKCIVSNALWSQSGQMRDLYIPDGYASESINAPLPSPSSSHAFQGSASPFCRFCFYSHHATELLAVSQSLHTALPCTALLVQSSFGIATRVCPRTIPRVSRNLCGYPTPTGPGLGTGSM
jgi:hypothetical protein